MSMQILAEWIDGPFPFVECDAHVFAPLMTTSARGVMYRCATCGVLAVDSEADAEDQPTLVRWEPETDDLGSRNP